MKKTIICFSAVLMLCSAVVSQAARKGELTLLMVPREEETLRVGMDIANRFDTLLIGYQLGANNSVSLHGWTGSEWVNITLDNFQKGDFFKKGPDSALVVTKAGTPVPRKMIPPADWCSNASMITTTELRPLLHLTGQYYNFSYKDWNWFAKRFNMEMEAINPDQLNVAWYHRRMSENLKPVGQQGASDLQYLATIRRPEAVTASEPAAEEIENPLTNEAPAAVIMGVGDADEELSTEPETPAEATAEENPEAAAEEPAESAEPETMSPGGSDMPAAAEEPAEEPAEDTEIKAEVGEGTAEVTGEMQ
jgi:hypothetical protein